MLDIHFGCTTKYNSIGFIKKIFEILVLNTYQTIDLKSNISNLENYRHKQDGGGGAGLLGMRRAWREIQDAKRERRMKFNI